MVVDKFLELLDSLGYPVRLQGSLLENESYPDSFFTWWNNSTESDSHYDNDEHCIIWDFDLNFYSTDPEKPYTMLDKAKSLLKNHGFIVSGAGYSVASDESTHTGRGMNVIYSEWSE